MSLGIGFNWPPKANGIDILIPRRTMRDIWQLATLYWPTLEVSASPKMASQNQNGVRSPKSERGYCSSLQHGPIGPRIASILHTISEIRPVKDCSPMAFNDPYGCFNLVCPRTFKHSTRWDKLGDSVYIPNIQFDPMMNGERDLAVGNFVLANTTCFSIA